MGIRFVSENNIVNSVIVSDALSVLQDLDRSASLISPYRITAIRQQICSFSLHMSLVWIPGHCGHQDHDKVDLLAKQALDKEVDLVVPFELKEACFSIERYIGREWKNKWSNIITGLAYKNTFGLFSRGYTTTLKPRGKETLIGRLQIQG